MLALGARWRRIRGAPAALLVAAALMVAPGARAEDGVTYQPAPGYAGSTEEFGACGFQSAETALLLMDNAETGRVVVGDTGCVQFTQQTPLEIAPMPHLLRVVGQQSGVERAGVYVVAPPILTPAAVTLPAGGTAPVFGQFFAPGRTPLLISSDGRIVAGPAITDGSGALVGQVSVLPDTPPGAYPIFIRDDPWLTNPPPLLVVVSAARPTDGNWLLNASTTLTRNTGTVTAKGLSTMSAPFTVSAGKLDGQGELTINLEMRVADASCRGESRVPFAVGGAQEGGTFRMALSGVNVSAPVTVTCDNGLSLPFALPAGSAAEPFDIAAMDGTTLDFETPGGASNPFVTVPDGFSGETHVLLTRT